MKNGHTLLAAAFIASLGGAYAWSQSEYADDYRAMQEARRQCELLGMECDYEAKPRKPKETDCFLERASQSAALSLTVIAP